MIAKLIRTDDWEALYIDGRIIDEGHHLDNIGDWIKWTNNYKLESVSYYYIQEEDLEEINSSGNFPDNINKLKGKYE